MRQIEQTLALPAGCLALGFFPDPSYVYKGFALETTVNNVGHKYPALAVHRTWFFNDSELSRQLDEVKREKEALKPEEYAELEEFNRVHGAEMEALKKAHNAEMETASSQAQTLFRQGRY